MSRFSYKTLILILLFLLIPIVLFLRISQRGKEVSAEWWNDNWMYRIRYTLENNGSDINETRKIKLDIDTSTIITAGKMQSNCNDARFTDQYGNTLDYFIDSENGSCNTNSTDFYIKLPQVPSGDQNVYLYYGNSSATAGKSNFFFAPDSTGEGLIGYWKMDEDSWINDCSTPTVNDHSYTNHGQSCPASTGPTGGSTGKLGKAGTFDRSNDYLNLTNLDVDVSAGGLNTVSFWMYWDGNQNMMPFGWASTYDLYINAGCFGFNTGQGNVYGFPSNEITPNNWTHIVATFYNGIPNNTNSEIYVNGVKKDLYACSNTTTASRSATSQARISGWVPSSGYYFGGMLDDFRIYNRGLTNNEISIIYNNNSGQTIDSPITFVPGSPPTPATEEVGGGPIAYWKFDEGVGTSAFDSTTNQINGYFVGSTLPQWQTSDNCISDKCLKLTNSGEINFGNKFKPTTNAFSVSLWLKANSLSTPDAPEIFSKYQDLGHLIHLRVGYNNEVEFMVRGVGASIEVNTNNNSIEENKWYFLTAVYNPQGTTRIYLNGQANGSTSTANAGDLSNGNNGNVLVGRGFNGFRWNGLLDEVKIFPYARTEAQIKADYTSGLAGMSSSSDSSVNIGGASSGKALSDGLVGYWKFDEGVGTTTVDSSGNNNLATFGTGDSAPSWASGKYGIGVSFGGINYLEIGTTQNITNSITLAAWVKPTSGGVVIGKWSSHGLVVGPNYIKWVIWGKDWSTYPTITNNQWSHITAVYDYDKQLRSVYVNGVGVGETSTTGTLNVNSNPYSIGKWSTQEFFQGSLDEIRVYNRALSPTEVKQLYEYAPGPVAYWKFEEGIGTTAFDSSGNNKNGILGTGNSAPSWTTGKIGKSLKFDGTYNHIKVSPSTNLNPTTFTVQAWVKIVSYPPSTYGYIISNESGFSGYALKIGDGAIGTTNKAVLITNSGVSPQQYTNGTTTLSLNTWYYLTGTYNGNTAKIYVNGNLENTQTYVLSQNSYPLTIGSWAQNGATPSRYFSGYLDEVKIYNYARTQKQILEDMAGSPPPGSTAKVSTPLVWYKFDEGFGSTVHNSGSIGSTANGVLGTSTAAPSWTNNSKFGKALIFTATNNTKVTTPITNTNGLNIRGAISFSGWYKRNTNTGYQTLYDMSDTCTSVDWDGYLLRFTDQNLVFYASVNDASGSNPFQLSYYNANSTADTTNWHHLVATWDGTTNTNGVKMYIDGKLATQTTAVADATNMATLNGYNFITGTLMCNTHSFDGLIDEVKIYNYALTADEVKQDYNQGSTFVFGSSNQTIGATTTSLEYCLPGDTSPCSPPVAEWKFEEGVGTTAYDSSGNNNHGIFGTGSSAPSWTTGKIGKALNFSTNKYIDAGTSPNFNITGSVTIQAWVKPNAGTGQQGIIGNSVFQYPFGLYLRHSPGSDVGFWVNPDGNRSYMMAGTINYGSWNHVTGTWDGTNLILYINGQFISNSKTTDAYSRNFTNLLIGNVPGVASPVYFDGLIDQVRIYNYARTPAQIAYDYNQGAPVGHWKLDECQGTTIHDSSGNGNHGTLSIGASGTQTSPGTCPAAAGAWANGKLGKINSSLNFDGSDDYVPVTGFKPQVSNGFTASAWFKTNSSGVRRFVINQWGSAGAGNASWGIEMNTSNQIVFETYSGASAYLYTTSNTYNNSSWNHAVITYNGTSMKSYINGTLLDTRNATVQNSTNYDLHIGQEASGGEYWLGQIDDVRIYNYALTGTQIKTLYNNGSINFR